MWFGLHPHLHRKVAKTHSFSSLTNMYAVYLHLSAEVPHPVQPSTHPSSRGLNIPQTRNAQTRLSLAPSHQNLARIHLTPSRCNSPFGKRKSGTRIPWAPDASGQNPEPLQRPAKHSVPLNAYTTPSHQADSLLVAVPRPMPHFPQFPNRPVPVSACK
ncbi:hypothetical protein IQ07DRAFT_657262 [Pyrenochaeta sp. DS3sAY3a]|nr:hypothetical protein IQ07DRAFT_657262 [Pyrenochaeta sp. DS3sAY3a]